MKKLGLVIAPLVLCINGFSQSIVSTEEAPFGGGFGGAGECLTSEPIALSGTLQTTTLQVFTGNTGMVQFHVKEGAGSVGVGMITGSNYTVEINEFAKFVYDRNTISNVTLKQRMTLKGSGPDSNFSIGYTVRFVSDDAGVFHTVFEKFAECKRN